MNREEAFNHVEKSIVDQLDLIHESPSPVREDMELESDLDLDQLDRTEIVMDLEERLGIEVTDEEFETLVKVKDLVDLVERKTAEPEQPEEDKLPEPPQEIEVQQPKAEEPKEETAKEETTEVASN